MRDLENQIWQLASILNKRPQGSLPNDRENPRKGNIKQCNVITRKSGRTLGITEKHGGFEHESEQNHGPLVQESLILSRVHPTPVKQSSPLPFPRTFWKKEHDGQF